MAMHQGASGDMHSSSWPSGAAVAGPPTAPVAAAAAGGVMTIGSIATVAGTLVIFVVIGAGLVSLHYLFDDRGRRHAPRRRAAVAAVVATAAAASGPPGASTRTCCALCRFTVYRAAAPGSGKDAVECAVCLAELEDGEAARFLSRSGHGFHAACFDAWLASHVTCPLCRLTVAAKHDASSPPPASALLPPVPPEPANYAANLAASVLLGVSDQGAVNMASSGDKSASSAGDAAVLVIEIPELAMPAPTPRDAAKSPGSARPRSFRRPWSFGRHGAGPSFSCSCSAGEGADVEQGVELPLA